MKTLDRYIVGEFLKLFIMLMVSLIGIYIIVDFFQRIRMFLSNDATFLQMFQYFLFLLPTVISQMLPVSVLLSALLTFGILSRNSEITAMKANGVSLYRLSLSVILLSVLIAVATFVLTEYIVPATNERVKHIKYIDIQNRQSLGSFKNNEVWYKGEKGIYNFALVDTRTGTIKGATLHYLDESMNLLTRIDAREAQWKEGRWIFRDLLITRFSDNGLPRIEHVPEKIIALPEEPEDFTVVQKDSSEMGFVELRNYIRKISVEGYDATRYVTDLHGKIAFPVICVILAVLGISFSIRSERSGGIAQSIGAGIVIGFSYWLLYAFTISLGHSGTLPPVLAAWMANIFFGAVALFFLVKVRT